MVVDRRHDHSFRVPRPDLSAKLGTNNACNDCHTGKSSDWAAAAIEGWFGPNREGLQNYGPAFHAAWHDEPGAATLLAAVAADSKAPAFARASALADLAGSLTPANLGLAQKGLANPDPMLRMAALDMLDGVPPEQLWPVVSPLLSDPIRGVRLRAASLLAAMPSDKLSDSDRKRLDQAFQEFLAAQRLNADRPEARAMLGSVYVRRGQTAEAEAEFKAALKLSPAYGPASANLADLYRQLGREADAESVLRKAIETSPKDAGLHHALGLALVRLKRQDEAIAELRRAAELEPDRARYAYVYAVGLEASGHRSDAIQVLKDNLARHPGGSRHSVRADRLHARRWRCRRRAPICRATCPARANQCRAQSADRDIAAPGERSSAMTRPCFSANAQGLRPSLNFIDACEPSQKGLFRDAPHRQSVTRFRTS